MCSESFICSVLTMLAHSIMLQHEYLDKVIASNVSIHLGRTARKAQSLSASKHATGLASNAWKWCHVYTVHTHYIWKLQLREQQAHTRHNSFLFEATRWSQREDTVCVQLTCFTASFESDHKTCPTQNISSSKYDTGIKRQRDWSRRGNAAHYY